MTGHYFDRTNAEVDVIAEFDIDLQRADWSEVDLDDEPWSPARKPARNPTEVDWEPEGFDYDAWAARTAS